MTIFVGAALPPIEHSVVIVENGIIKAIGPQASVPIPTGSRKISGLGRTIAPLDPSKPVRQGDEANFGLYAGDPSNPTNLTGRMIGAHWEAVR